jgi:hypothetical protein
MRGRKKKIQTEEIQDKVIENVLEWITGDRKIAVTVSESKIKTKIKALSKKYPDQVSYLENKDGSIFAHIPYKALKISISNRVSHLSDEQKLQRAEIMRKAREKKIEK